MKFLSLAVLVLALVVSPAFGQCPGGVCGLGYASAPGYASSGYVVSSPGYVVSSPRYVGQPAYVGGFAPSYGGYTRVYRPSYSVGVPGFGSIAPSYGVGSCPTCR